jgi:tetratricopeptide (TPR) repeat protein
MGLFSVNIRQTGRLGFRACLLALALLVPAAQAQSENLAGSATLKGIVRDSRGRAVAAANVYLQNNRGGQGLSTRADSQGVYSFSSLREGKYTLRAELTGRAGTAGPISLAPKEVKIVDLILDHDSVPQASAAGAPEFFDEPQFTVAGVTQATNAGGHGSDAVLRTTEALAKATVSLSKESPSTAHPVSSAAAEQSLRDAVARDPGRFEANYRLGKFLIGGGKAGEAIPYLEQASRLNPGDYENSYELARAYADSGDLEHARANAHALVAREDKAELHHLLGDVEERLSNPLEAVREYQRAAELDPNEPNLFDWGTELLKHRALEPATEVFSTGNRRFPNSVRILIGLGVAWYARGSYDQAAQRLFEASDLNPTDPAPYLFLGKMLSAETAQSAGFVERLGRFARLQPENALANYYYAVSLRKLGSEGTDNSQVESLLEKAVRLDPNLGEGYLQLGILDAEKQDFPKAIAAYQEAIEASPRLDEAHYRLAQAYLRNGERAKAHEQLQLYDRLSKKTAEEVERERREITQFVFALRDKAPAAHPQPKP